MPIFTMNELDLPFLKGQQKLIKANLKNISNDHDALRTVLFSSYHNKNSLQNLVYPDLEERSHKCACEKIPAMCGKYK